MKLDITSSASLSIALLLCSVTGLADNWTDPDTGIEWTYRVVNGEVILGGNNGARAIDTSTFGAVTIPPMLGGCIVTSIGNSAFAGCNAVTLITIPQSVTNIETRAFQDCSGLMSMTIPEGVERIGAMAFYCCSGITKIIIPDSVTTIEGSVFPGCSSLTEIILPKNLKSIAEGCFSGDGRLSVITIPEGVTNIARQAFYDCRNLANIVIPNSVVSVGEIAFHNAGLRQLTVPSSIYSIGSGAFECLFSMTNLVIESGVPGIAPTMFRECKSIKNVLIPDSVTSIGNGAFRQCANLENVHIPQAVISIGNSAFEDCSSLVEVSIPKNVQVVGGYAFKGCTNLNSIKFLGDAPMADVVTFENTHPDCTAYVSRKSTGWDVAIPGEWMGIKIDYYDPALYTVRFDANGGSLGTVTNEVSYGEGEAFRNLPVPSKDGCLFVGWFTTAEGDMRITEGMLVSGDMTLYAHWKESAPELTIEDGVLVHVDLNGEKMIEIPSSVTSIAAEAFAGCQEIERVTIPESVTSIPFAAFANCDKLWANWYKAMANGGSRMEKVSLTVTNVVVHYVATSTQSEAVTPPETTGIVSVIAEVTSGGPVAIASTWAEQYPGFAAKFGADFTAALTKPTGKRDGAGNAMLVWQDYVAGTDPTNPDDVFKASITFDKDTGEPVICWTPELSTQEAAKRLYRKYGKVRLNDSDWTPIDGDASDYNFFKVTVEMR